VADISASAPGGIAAPPLWRTVSLLGIAQIISWGTLYYTLTVLAAPIREELGFNDLMIFGAFTLGQLVSGAAAPFVGRRIDRAGGRGVMSLGSFVAALALVLVASSREPILFTLGWALAGIAMAACLYDPAFATLYLIAPDRYRRAVTGLTLFGGFASTVFWPLSHALADMWGWRTALLAFALLHLLLCLPIHRLSIPAAHETHRTNRPIATGVGSYASDRRFVWLAATFAAATFVFSALSAYMISALGTRGFTAEQAVWIGALIGPMQVLARVIEWFFARRISAIGVGFAACTLALLGVVLLNVIPATVGFGVLFALCYGASNGILTIARGTVPAQLFGPQQQGALLGALARPSFVAKALAPALFAAGLSAGFSMRTGVALLAFVSALAFICLWFATRDALTHSYSPGGGQRSADVRARECSLDTHDFTGGRRMKTRKDRASEITPSRGAIDGESGQAQTLGRRALLRGAVGAAGIASLVPLGRFNSAGAAADTD
jgi:MFS family permease